MNNAKCRIHTSVRRVTETQGGREPEKRGDGRAAPQQSRRGGQPWAGGVRWAKGRGCPGSGGDWRAPSRRGEGAGQGGERLAMAREAEAVWVPGGGRLWSEGISSLHCTWAWRRGRLDGPNNARWAMETINHKSSNRIYDMCHREEEEDSYQPSHLQMPSYPWFLVLPWCAFNHKSRSTHTRPYPSLTLKD